MKPFDKKCPQCSNEAIADTNNARNGIWCPSCGYKGTLTEITKEDKYAYDDYSADIKQSKINL